MQSEIVTTVQKATVSDKYLLAQAGGAYKCRFLKKSLKNKVLE